MKQCLTGHNDFFLFQVDGIVEIENSSLGNVMLEIGKSTNEPTPSAEIINTTNDRPNIVFLKTRINLYLRMSLFNVVREVHLLECYVQYMLGINVGERKYSTQLTVVWVTVENCTVTGGNILDGTFVYSSSLLVLTISNSLFYNFKLYTYSEGFLALLMENTSYTAARRGEGISCHDAAFVSIINCKLMIHENTTIYGNLGFLLKLSGDLHVYRDHEWCKDLFYNKLLKDDNQYHSAFHIANTKFEGTVGESGISLDIKSGHTSLVNCTFSASNGVSGKFVHHRGGHAVFSTR